MEGGKKWLVVLTEEQHEWIKDTSSKVGLKGSDIVREIVDRVMNEDSKKFRESLANAQLKMKLQSINDKKAALMEEERELKRQLGTTDRTPERERVTT